MTLDLKERLELAWQRTGRDSYSRASRADTEGHLIYAIGDVHGRYDLLRILLARIAADARSSTVSRTPILIMLGDYIDRGPRSSDVLDALTWLLRRSPFDVRLLRGNHEQCLIDFLNDPIAGSEWLSYGGIETLRSYGIIIDVTPSAEGLLTARDELMDCMPAAHLALLHGLRLILQIGDYAFVHAGIDPNRDLGKQKENDLLWIRRPFVDYREVLPKVIVHGHSWTGEAPELHEQRIGIDTGAFTTDVLTAARLHDGTVRFLRTV